jgi:hypothetical protein
MRLAEKGERATEQNAGLTGADSRRTGVSEGGHWWDQLSGSKPRVGIGNWGDKRFSKIFIGWGW